MFCVVRSQICFFFFCVMLCFFYCFDTRTELCGGSVLAQRVVLTIVPSPFQRVKS